MGLCTAPGSNRWPKGLCDTAGVVSLSRRLRRIEEPRMAAASLGVALLVVLAAYAYAVAIGPAVGGGIVAGGAPVGRGGAGRLYAWGAGTRAPSPVAAKPMGSPHPIRVY